MMLGNADSVWSLQQNAELRKGGVQGKSSSQLCASLVSP